MERSSYKNQVIRYRTYLHYVIKVQSVGEDDLVSVLYPGDEVILEEGLCC